MSHFGTPNTVANRTCPLRTVVAVSEVRAAGWVTQTFDCGHEAPTYAFRTAVGKRRRCIKCGDAAAAPGARERVLKVWPDSHSEQDWDDASPMPWAIWRDGEYDTDGCLLAVGRTEDDAWIKAAAAMPKGEAAQ